MSDTQSKTVAIVGAGASGLMAAIAAARGGTRVVVLEQLDRPGAKLLATGGGRCNLTNTLSAEAHMAAFGRQGRFMAPALAEMSSADLREFFDRLGVPTYADPTGRVYPRGNSAAKVRDALRDRCRELGVEFRLAARASELWIERGRLLGVMAGERRIEAGAVIVATGGRSYVELGGTGGGYALARQAGHEIVEPTPALVPLITRETWPAGCAGLSVAGARVWIDLKGQSRVGRTGDLLFTHRGISGPVVLDISGDVGGLLPNRPDVPVCIDLTAGQHAKPGKTPRAPKPAAAKEIAARINAWRAESGSRSVRRLLGEFLPASLARAVCTLAGLDSQTAAAQLPAEKRDALAVMLTALPLTVVGTEGFELAMVTRGGVSLKNVDPNTLQSRLLAGLHFAGEVLDLDGPSGGYNLQWAFASGHLVGGSAGG